jgi:predicted  nucleic acid-binding Zn-ribbon protein
MTVGRPHATTREDILRDGCFKCGGPHFARNKKTGAVCTANRKPEDLKDKPVLPKPVDLVAKPSHNLQHAAPRAYASVVSSPIDSKLVDNLKLEIQRLSDLVEDMKEEQKRVQRFLRYQHLAHFAVKGCTCSRAFQDGSNFLLDYQACHDLYQARISSSPSASAAQCSSHSPVPMDFDASNGPETKIDSTASPSAAVVASPSSIPVAQPVHSSAAFAASALDSKRASKPKSNSAAPISSAAESKDSISSSSSSISSSSSSAVSITAPVLSPEEAKAAFKAPTNRMRSASAALGARKGKKKKHKVAAQDFFHSAPQSSGQSAASV